MSKSKENRRRKRDNSSSPELSSTCPACKAPICACTEYVPVVEGAEFSPLAQDRNDPSPRPHKRQKNAEGAAMKRDAAGANDLPIVDLDSDSDGYAPRIDALAKQKKCNPDDGYTCLICATVHGVPTDATVTCSGCKETVCDDCFKRHIATNRSRGCCKEFMCCHAKPTSCHFCKESGASVCTHPRDEKGHYICSECKESGMAFWMVDCRKACHKFLCEPCHDKRVTANPRPDQLCCKEDFCCHPQSLRDELAKKAQLDAATATMSRTCALCPNRSGGLTAACHICNKQLCDPCFMAHSTPNKDRRCCDGEYCCHARSQENKGTVSGDDSDYEDHASGCKTDECEVCEDCDARSCLYPGCECGLCGVYICEDCQECHARSCK